MNYLASHGADLASSGFDVLPILGGTKRPDIEKGWQHIRATPETIAGWLDEGRGPGVGILTANTPGVDLDVTDETILAKLVEYCEDNIGATVHRIGRAPKRLLVYRTDKPFAKRRLEFKTPAGDKQLLEVLCAGQQFVAFAAHPDTGKPYEWPNGSLLDTHADLLPTMTEAHADALLDFYASIVPADWRDVSRSKKPTDDKPQGVNQTAPIDKVAAALSFVPNADRHYDEWVRIGHAIKAATNHSEDGRDLFHAWSEKSEKYDFCQTERAWDSIAEVKTIGAGTIFDEALRHGFQMPIAKAADDFDDVPFVMLTFAQQRQFEMMFAERKEGASGVASGALKSEQLHQIAEQVAAKVRAIAAEAAKGARRFMSVPEMRALPEPEWLIEGVLQKRTAALLFGASNTFKSFAAIDMGLSIATSRDWHGHKTARAKVGFVATEGANGVGRQRIPGWLDYHAVPASEQHSVVLLAGEIALDSKADVDWLWRECKAQDIEVLILDIFKGTLQGSEIEDTTAAAWVHGAQRLIRAGITVLAVAHSGWQDKTRARMHSHLWGSFDSRLRMEGDKDARTACLSIERHKDADSTGSWGFRLEASHGTLVPVLDHTVVPDAKTKWSGQERIASQALDLVLASVGEVKSGDGWPDCRVAPIEAWRQECLAQGITRSDNVRSKNMAFTRASGKLVARGAVRIHEQHAWGTFEA